MYWCHKNRYDTGTYIGFAQRWEKAEFCDDLRLASGLRGGGGISLSPPPLGNLLDIRQRFPDRQPSDFTGGVKLTSNNVSKKRRSSLIIQDFRQWRFCPALTVNGGFAPHFNFVGNQALIDGRLRQGHPKVSILHRDRMIKASDIDWSLIYVEASNTLT